MTLTDLPSTILASKQAEHVVLFLLRSIMKHISKGYGYTSMKCIDIMIMISLSNLKSIVFTRSQGYSDRIKQ